MKKILFLILLLLPHPGFTQNNQINVGGIGIYPIRLDLSANQKTASLTLTNTEDHSISMQSSLVKWEQLNGQDVYTDEDDYIATPPLFTLEPFNGKQIIRVGSASAVEVPSQEKTWRVVLEQLPDPVSDKENQGTQIKIRVKMTVPVFLSPATITHNLVIPKNKLVLKDNVLSMQAFNQGSIHEKIIAIKVQDDHGNLIGQQNGAIYILSGAFANIQIQLKSNPSGKLHISVITENAQTSSSFII